MAERSRGSERETVRRSCPVCEASCGLVIEVDRSAGKVVAIHGDDDDPRSRGYLCPKAFAPAAVASDPDRIQRPLRRDRATRRWSEIGWEAAFELVADRLRTIRVGEPSMGT